MTARVLVVDDVEANLKLLRAKLTSEYLEVETARSGPEALERVSESPPDIVLLDVMMPGMDGFEVCRRIKADPKTTHVPVVMLTCLDRPEDRVAALDAGADDFLTKPVEPLGLMARVRNLIRLKMLTDELRLREATGREMGLSEKDPGSILDVQIADARVLAIEDRSGIVAEIQRALTPAHRVHVEGDVEDALLLARRVEFDLILVGLSLSGSEGLRVCSQLRTSEETRRTPLLALVEAGDRDSFVRALDIGVDGLVTLPFDPEELQARAHAQIRAKRFRDGLRQNVRMSLEKAITDPLTGLHNRRYLDVHLPPLVSKSAGRGRPVSLLLIDIDHFKAVNDTWGHDVGDEVLREVAQRLASGIRGLDMSCRYGGEEFVVVLSGTPLHVAGTVAERLRKRVADEPLSVRTDAGPMRATVSIGVAESGGEVDDAEALLKRADLALYRAKKEGRNRVVLDA